MSRFAVILLLATALTACGGGTGDEAAENETVALGERPAAFNQCTTCHAVEAGKNGIGPSLAGVYDAKAGHVGDYAYSSAMRDSGLVWDDVTLDRYLENPREIVPGTKMSYVGLRDAEQRAAVIAYLKTL